MDHYPRGSKQKKVEFDRLVLSPPALPCIGVGMQRREEQKREDQRRERVRRKKMQMREKVDKSRFTVFFQWFVAPVVEK